MRDDVDFAGLREQFARSCGIDEVVEPEVIQAFLDDPLDMHHLLVCRDVPELRALLLREVRRKVAATHLAGNPESLTTLTSRLSAALMKWAKSGFVKLTPARLEARWAACQACPNLVHPPPRGAYHLVARVTEESRVCALCGCVAAQKVKLPTESCPASHDSASDLTRWGEPRAIPG